MYVRSLNTVLRQKKIVSRSSFKKKTTTKKPENMNENEDSFAY